MSVSRPTVRWAGHPRATAPVAQIRAARRRDPATVVVDDAGRAVAFGPLALVRETARELLRAGLDTLLAGLVRLGVRRRPTAAPPSTPGSGPTVVVVPVLPDLSHTFVYREVLAMLRQRPDWRVMALERRDDVPLHDEAKALLAHAAFLPRDGVLARTWRVVRWLATRRGRALFALYRSAPGGSCRDLLGKQVLRDPRHPGNALALADWLRRDPAGLPRHLHVYSSTYATNVTMGAALLLGVPFSVSSYVDFEFPYAHRLLAEKVARATFFRVVTAYCADRLRQLLGPDSPPPDRLPVLLLGLDLGAWQARAVPPRRGILVSAARLVPKKGLALLPPALAELARRGLPFRWLVVGDGPELAAIQAACVAHDIADRVEFRGPQGNHVVRQLLLAADAAVLPCVVAADGERDGIPIFLCEAMALGVPVVTTRVSGIPELVRDGDTGVLCAPGDTNALADALARVLGDPEFASAIGARGRAAVHRELDVDRLVGRLIARIEA